MRADKQPVSGFDGGVSSREDSYVTAVQYPLSLPPVKSNIHQESYYEGK